MTDYEFNEFDESTPTDADSTDYESVYNAVYDALTDYNSDSDSLTKSTRSVKSVEQNDDSILEFGTETDATFYTLTAEPQTCAQQNVAYLLEIRNLLLIFILGYFVLTLFYRLKNSIFSFTR